MTVASRLPEGFQTTEATPKQTDAIAAFVERAAEVAPEIGLIGSRKTSSGHIKILLEYPEGQDTWSSLEKLAELANEIHREFGVFLNFD